MANTSSRGRPRASSKAMLEDAALDLFVEQSYAGTTVDQIAQRAGVSRNTFFNYFDSKSDVFWVFLDERLAEFAPALEATDADAPVMTAVYDAVLAVGAGFGPGRVPWALTQTELIGSVHELQASALARLSRQAEIVADFVAARVPHPLPVLLARAVAYSVIGAAVAAVQSWASAGTTRGDLVPYLAEALAPIRDGYAAVLDA